MRACGAPLAARPALLPRTAASAAAERAPAVPGRAGAAHPAPSRAGSRRAAAAAAARGRRVRAAGGRRRRRRCSRSRSGSGVLIGSRGDDAPQPGRGRAAAGDHRRRAGGGRARRDRRVHERLAGRQGRLHGPAADAAEGRHERRGGRPPRATPSRRARPTSARSTPTTSRASTAATTSIYSGVFDTRKQAKKALRRLKDDFPGAKVVQVSAGGGLAAKGDAGALSGKKKEATVGKKQLEGAPEALARASTRRRPRSCPTRPSCPARRRPRTTRSPGGGGRGGDVIG